MKKWLQRSFAVILSLLLTSSLFIRPALVANADNGFMTETNLEKIKVFSSRAKEFAASKRTSTKVEGKAESNVSINTAFTYKYYEYYYHNLFENGTFSYDPDSDGTWIKDYNKDRAVPTFSWSMTEGYDDYHRCVKVNGSNIDGYYISATDINPNDIYHFYIMAKGSNVVANGEDLGVYTFIQQMDANGEPIAGTQNLGYQKGTFDWTVSSLTFKAAPDAKSFFVMFGVEGSGTALFDNVALIKAIDVENITFNKLGNTMRVGQSEQVTAQINPGYVLDKRVTWSVYSQTAENVVSVSQTGVVTALKPGTAIIRATCDLFPDKFGEYYVSVLDTQNIQIPQGAVIKDMIKHPTLPMVYLSDSKNKKVYSINYSTGEQKSITLPYTIERLAIGGNELYVNEVTNANGHNPSSSEDGDGRIGIIDMTIFKYIDSINVDIDPYDVAADDAGNIYVSSGSGYITYLKSYSRATKTETSKHGCSAGDSLLLNKTTERLYTNSNRTDQGSISSYKLQDGKISLSLTYYGRGIHYDNKNFADLSPDGKFIFTGGGNVFYSSADVYEAYEQPVDLRKVDLEHAFSLTGDYINAMAFDIESNAFYIGSDRGITAYTYNDFKVQSFAATSGKTAGLVNTKDYILALVENNGMYSLEKINKNILGKTPVGLKPNTSYLYAPPMTDACINEAIPYEFGTDAVINNTGTGHYKIYKLNPTETGDYKFLGRNLGGVFVYDEYGFNLVRMVNGGLSIVELEAGKTYYMRTSCFYMESQGTLSVTKIRLAKNIQMNRLVYDMKINETAKLIASVLPEDATYQNIVWTVKDVRGFAVASIFNGTLYAFSAGTAVLRAANENNPEIYTEAMVFVNRNEKDVNGDGVVNSIDVTLVKDHILGKTNDNISSVYDVNKDGKVTSKDLALISKAIQK